MLLGGSDQKHTGSNVMGKENCWQVHIRVTHAAMLGEGKVLADSDHRHIRIDICSDLILSAKTKLCPRYLLESGE